MDLAKINKASNLFAWHWYNKVLFRYLKGRHEGSTVLIVGAGVDALRVRDDRTITEGKVIIGLNYTNFIIEPDYAISAYQIVIGASEGAGKLGRTRFFHMVPQESVHEFFPLFGINRLRICRTGLRQGIDHLPLRFERDQICLRTNCNQFMAALHLSCILGAKKIEVIGVDLLSESHFYHKDTFIQAHIINGLQSEAAKIAAQKDKSKSAQVSVESSIRYVRRTNDEASRTSWMQKNPKIFQTVERFLPQFLILVRKLGVEVETHTVPTLLQQFGVKPVSADEKSN